MTNPVNNATNGLADFFLETDRLQIVKFTTDDVAFILDLVNTPSWLAYIGDRGVKTLHDAHQYILNGPLKSYEAVGFGLYRVKLKSSGISIGMCGLLKRDTLEDIDIGFAFLPDYVGLGYGYEAATAVMTYAHRVLGVARVVGITRPDNQLSIRLLEKLGLQFERTFRLGTSSADSLLFGTPITNL